MRVDNEIGKSKKFGLCLIGCIRMFVLLLVCLGSSGSAMHQLKVLGNINVPLCNLLLVQEKMVMHFSAKKPSRTLAKVNDTYIFRTPFLMHLF